LTDFLFLDFFSVMGLEANLFTLLDFGDSTGSTEVAFLLEDFALDFVGAGWDLG